jgi:hypothetical protein
MIRTTLYIDVLTTEAGREAGDHRRWSRRADFDVVPARDEEVVFDGATRRIIGVTHLLATPLTPPGLDPSPLQETRLEVELTGWICARKQLKERNKWLEDRGWTEVAR